MPMKKGYKKRGQKKRIGMRRRLGVPRPLKYNTKRVGGNNTARVSHTLTNTILPNTPYDFTIAGIVGARPLAHAPEYALYRISKVVLKYKPTADTFVSNPAFIGGGGAVSVPNLYWKMNRFADAPAAFDAQDLKRLGARPFRLDDKTYTMSYRPNILLSRATDPANPGAGGSDSGQLKMTPWLSTDATLMSPNAFAPSTTVHWGHFFIVDCAVNGAGTQPVATLDITIYYEFKNPRVDWNESATAVQRLTGKEEVEEPPQV